MRTCGREDPHMHQADAHAHAHGLHLALQEVVAWRCKIFLHPQPECRCFIAQSCFMAIGCEQMC